MDKKKILIVDDDPELRRGLNIRLRANHYDTAYAFDGLTAISMAFFQKPVDNLELLTGEPWQDLPASRSRKRCK